VSRFWSTTVRRLTPYVPGEQRAGADVVKLNTNENPYPPSAAVLRAIGAVDGRALRRYPDPGSRALRDALAAEHGLGVEQVFVGNGSDEVLALAFLAFFTDGAGPGRGLQYPAISYAFYPVYCDLHGIERRPLPLDGDFRFDPDDFLANESGICFPNPNAPTGVALPRAAVRRLLERHTDHVLLVDEAYADFGAESVIPLIDEFPNLLVCRTFSKGRALAGLRLGMAYGSRELIDGLCRVKDSFNSYPVDVVAERAGVASLADRGGYLEIVERIVATRERTVRELESRGFRVLPSAANFVFARPPDGEGETLFRRLGQAGVLVRHWSTPELAAWLRISIGTDADMARLFAVIDAVPDIDASR